MCLHYYAVLNQDETLSRRHRAGALTYALRELGHRLQSRRLEAGITQEQAAAGLDVSVQAIRNWESGRHELTQEHLVDMATLYGINTTDELLGASRGFSNSNPIKVKNIPLRGYLLDGSGQHGDLEIIPVPEFILQDHPAVFGLLVTGNSLEDAIGIRNGDFILVDPDRSLEEEGTHIFQLEDEIFAGIVETEGNGTVLRGIGGESRKLSNNRTKHLGKLVRYQRII